MCKKKRYNNLLMDLLKSDEFWFVFYDTLTVLKFEMILLRYGIELGSNKTERRKSISKQFSVI